jgi:manganese oxidase
MEDVALEYPAKTEGIGGKLMEPTEITADGTKVFDVTAMTVQWEVSPGKFVEATTYTDVVPAPEIHVEVGDMVRINFQNDLDESTDIHFHGIRVPNGMDGVDPYTQPAVPPGESFVYEFEALEPAVGIYHSHHNAQEQIPKGLFGAFTIGEMPIPEYLQDKGYTKVDKKVNMVLNDAGTIGLSLNGKSFPATEPYTLRIGEVMQVNYMNEGLTAHPMHMHQPMGWIIAKDGIPMDFPMPADTINVAPGERYTVLYKGTDVGVWAWHCHILTHAESSTGMFGMVTALIVTQ